MNNVMVVDNIPVARCSTATFSEYPHLRDLTFTEASQVDLLIGQDNSAALSITINHSSNILKTSTCIKFGSCIVLQTIIK